MMLGHIRTYVRDHTYYGHMSPPADLATLDSYRSEVLDLLTEGEAIVHSLRAQVPEPEPVDQRDESVAASITRNAEKRDRDEQRAAATRDDVAIMEGRRDRTNSIRDARVQRWVAAGKPNLRVLRELRDQLDALRATAGTSV